MEKTIKIKQDRYESAEEFRGELGTALFTILDLARCGDEVSLSDLANNLYVLEYLLRYADISVE